MSDIRHMKKYAELGRAKSKLDADLVKVKAKMKDLEEGVLEYMERQGQSKATFDGTTVYTKRELWAGREDGITHEQAKEALDGCKLGEYCAPRLNTQSFSAFCREIDATGESVTDKFPALKGVIKVSEVFKVGYRNS